MIGSDLYDVYLGMICSMMLLMLLLKCIKSMGVNFKTKKKLKCVYKYLSRIKLDLLLSEWWQADNMTILCKYEPQRGIYQESLIKKNSCSRIYERTKSHLGLNVRTKAWVHGYVIMQAMCATYTCCLCSSKRPCGFVPDTDSFISGLYNTSICCMDNNIHNFVTKLTPTPNIRVIGVGNQLMAAKGRGTVLWKIEENNGLVHDKLFPGTLYIMELKMCLCSSHPWCQLADNHVPKRVGNWQYQTADSFIMEWDHRKFHHIVPGGRRTNTGHMRSAPGTKHYCAFAAVHDQ
jgi:hypothetical protein